MSCGVCCRRSLDPAFLWLWCRVAAVAPIQPLAREHPYASGASLKRQKKKGQKNSPFVANKKSCYQKKKKKKKRKKFILTSTVSEFRVNFIFDLKYIGTTLCVHVAQISRYCSFQVQCSLCMILCEALRKLDVCIIIIPQFTLAARTPTPTTCACVCVRVCVCCL